MISFPTASDIAAILDCFRRCRSPLRHKRYIPQEDRKLLHQIDPIHRHLGKYPLKTLKLLVKMNFPLPRNLNAWLPYYFHLAAFHKRHDHCRVPQHYKPCLALPRWIQRQRSHRMLLNDLRKELLNRLDPHWHTTPTLKPLYWTQQYQKLRAFKKKYGHCRVPSQWKEDTSLALWVTRQRSLTRKRDYPAERRALLEALGFDWNPNQNIWLKHYRELVSFQRKHGHCRVPNNKSRKNLLTWWTSYTRMRRHMLSKEQIRLLDKIDFDWLGIKIKRKMLRKRMFKELEDFVKAHGHARVTAKSCPSLAPWVIRMRTGKVYMSPKEIQRLKALGFVWDARQWRWEKWLAKLKDFKRQHGHFRIPWKNESLSRFCITMRQQIRRGTLPKERLQQLRALGFV